MNLCHILPERRGWVNRIIYINQTHNSNTLIFRSALFNLESWTKYHTSKFELSVWFIQLSKYFYHTVRFITSLPFQHTHTHTHTHIYIYIYRFDQTEKMKRSFFQAAVVLILLYGCTTWTLTKRLKKKLDGNYTRMLRAILNNSWQQHPTRHQLYGHLPPITKTIQARRTRHTGRCWRSKDELICDVLQWTPAYG